MDLSKFTDEQVKNHIILRACRLFEKPYTYFDQYREYENLEEWVTELKKRLDDRVDKPKEN